MFWIGLIVGIVISAIAIQLYFIYVMNLAGASWDDMAELGRAGFEAFGNRESKLVVMHDDECLYETVFKEN